MSIENGVFKRLALQRSAMSIIGGNLRYTIQKNKGHNRKT